jgi:hypothetical protein
MFNYLGDFLPGSLILEFKTEKGKVPGRGLSFVHLWTDPVQRIHNPLSTTPQ